ncbi:MAG: hypothetical protein ACRC4N_10640, partial [Gammaproteobacteria bacterium]
SAYNEELFEDNLQAIGSVTKTTSASDIAEIAKQMTILQELCYEKMQDVVLECRLIEADNTKIKQLSAISFITKESVFV